MKVLVTGGSGLVGMGIKNNKNNNHEFIFLSSKDGDLTDYDVCKKLFINYCPDVVIHLAANVGGLYKNMKQPVEMLNSNMEMNSNIVKCCHQFNVKKAFFCLSTCIFPDKTTYPIDESMLHKGEPHSSNFAYAYAKRMLEIQCRAYNQQYGTQFICIIPTNIYGKYDNFNLEDSHVIPGLIHKAYLAKKNNQPFVLKGSGKAFRQFIYADDMAKLILYMIDNYNKTDSIILSVDMDREVSIETIAVIITNKFGIEKIKYDTSFSDGQYKKTANNAKLRNFLQEHNISFEFTPIDIGLNDTIDWFIENYEICRK